MIALHLSFKRLFVRVSVHVLNQLTSLVGVSVIAKLSVKQEIRLIHPVKTAKNHNFESTHSIRECTAHLMFVWRSTKLQCYCERNFKWGFNLCGILFDIDAAVAARIPTDTSLSVSSRRCFVTAIVVLQLTVFAAATSAFHGLWWTLVAILSNSLRDWVIKIIFFWNDCNSSIFIQNV